MLAEQPFRIDVGRDDEVSAVLELASDGSKGNLFACAHGAGGHMSDRAMLALSPILRGAGLDVLRFNFPYREKGSGRPDAMPRLQECIAAVAGHARSQHNVTRLIIGGRSMGGRAASMLAATGFACDGVLLLAYPLHPAGRTDKLRMAHLAGIRAPVLCINGTRDPLCDRGLMDEIVAGLPDTWRMHWIESADHSFHVLKSSGRTDREVLDEVGRVTGGWLGNRGAA